MSRDLVFEIGVEEIPSAALYEAIAQLRTAAEKAFTDARLGYDTITTTGAPRRLVLRVTGLAERQDDQQLRIKGPAVRAAYDESGAPTPALLGFARGKGVEIADLTRVEEAGGEYVYAVIDRAGESAASVLPALLAQLAEKIEWPKSQRWGSGTARFIRPVRWLLALRGDEVVPVEFAGLTAERLTFGHRFLAPGARSVASAAEYDTVVRDAAVVGDHEERARLVREGIADVARALGATAVVPEKTFAEVVNLVEWPTVAAGRFDTDFLAVPREVLETAMTKHQRYFPVEAADGSLTNAFIVVHNGDPARTDAIVAGHERVIRARLADAAFFYKEDLAADMEVWVDSLEAITFHVKLGTLGAKVRRIESLVGRLAELSAAGPAESAQAARAAHLAKADLVSHAVIEFPVLQGVMGRYYALAAGEESAVADAVREHYQPRFAGDALPASVAGRLVSAADRLDTMAGIFAVGMAPTGSADPYALRRGAIGLLGMMLDGGLALTLDEAISAALAGYAGTVEFDVESTGAAIKAFVLGRLENILRERGHAYDTVAAVLALTGDDPADALARAEALTTFRASSDDMEDLSIAFSRARNLAQPAVGDAVDPALMGAEELAVLAALDEAAARVDDLLAQRAYSALLETFAALRAPIDAFFESVMVMAEDEALRTNRLRLLNRFIGVFGSFADFSKLAG